MSDEEESVAEDSVDDDKDSLFKSKHYFDLGDAVDDFNTTVFAKDTAVAAAKLAGKTLFNVGVFAGKLGVGVLKHAAQQAPHTLAGMAQNELKNNPDLTDEKREKYQEAIQRSKDLRKQEELDERERIREEERQRRE